MACSILPYDAYIRKRAELAEIVVRLVQQAVRMGQPALISARCRPGGDPGADGGEHLDVEPLGANAGWRCSIGEVIDVAVRAESRTLTSSLAG